jgi:zinc transport system ATP-binding protein
MVSAAAIGVGSLVVRASGVAIARAVEFTAVAVADSMEEAAAGSTAVVDRVAADMAADIAEGAAETKGTRHVGDASCVPALAVRNLSVGFDRTIVIERLSFEVPRGSALAIVGPNGAGKSVLAKALIGALPYQGTITWQEHTRIGYVPQKLDIERDLPITGRDFLHAKAVVSRASEGDVVNVLGLVGLKPESVGQSIGALSGGQFQRLLVAAALIGHPTVLLLDEPTAGVDEPGQETINVTLDRLRDERDLTILFISHDLSVVYHHASNVLCLSRGHTCFGVPRKVLTPQLLQELYGAPVAYHVHHDLRP